MKITDNMISQDLRLMGILYRFFVPKITKKKNDKSFKGNKNYFLGNKKKHVPFYSKRMTYHFVKRSDGTRMRVLVFKPFKKKEKVPGVLWLHGGGYAVGTPEMAFLSMAHILNKQGNAVIVSPAYTLSSTKPYPAALMDSYQTILWMKKHAEELSIRDDQIFVGGESAGGGLAVALCLYARDKGEVKIAFQMPLYPMLDDRMKTESMRENDAPVWNEVQNASAWKRYLHGMNPDRIPKYASPARETDYRNLPPAVTFVGSIEPFRDETVEYVKQLKQANVHAVCKVFPGAYHAFDMLVPWSKSAKEARKYIMKQYRYASKHYTAPQKERE